MLLALFCAFDLPLLLEHVLGRTLAGTFGGTDVVPHPTLGVGAVLAFQHFWLLHGSIAAAAVSTTFLLLLALHELLLLLHLCLLLFAFELVVEVGFHRLLSRSCFVL